MSPRRTLALLVLLLAALSALLTYQGRTGSEPLDARGRPGEQAIRAYLEQIHDGPGLGNVPPADGQFLHNFIVERDFRQGLEVGTSNGYSAIWMGMALRETNGHLITLEIDPERAQMARQNFARVGLEEIVELREGDALRIIPELEGPFDLVFIDAYKEDYVRYFHLLHPKVKPGGAILAHDALWQAEKMQPFLQAIRDHPDFDTRITRSSKAGISVSTKVDNRQEGQMPEKLPPPAANGPR